MSWSKKKKVNRLCEICNEVFDELTQYNFFDIRYDGRDITVDVYLELEAIRFYAADSPDNINAVFWRGDERRPNVCNACQGRMLLQFGEELITGSTGDKNNVN